MTLNSANPRADLSASRPRSILVVEDEVMIRMAICEELRDTGCHVIEAASGDEAVAILKSGVSIDIVLSDVRMPGTVDGLLLLAFVREHFSSMPVIITSGHLPPDLALAGGATHFLAKPYRLRQAVDLVARAMRALE